MAVRNYKINDAIQVVYQAAGSASGATVTMEIYDETGAKDPTNFPDVTMTEIGSSGRYRGSFTPDAEGEWEIQISDSAGGKAVRQYSVGPKHLADIASAVDDIDAQLDVIEGKVDALDSPPMIG